MAEKKHRTLLSRLQVLKCRRVKNNPDTLQKDYVGVVEESISIPLSFLTSGTIEQVIAKECM